MAFDRENPTDLAALKSEVNTDPLSMGYDPDGSSTVLLNLLNDPVENLGGQTGNDFVTTERLLDSIFAVTVGAADQFKMQLLFEASIDFSDDLSRFKARIAALSGALSDAVDTIIRDLSRGEFLFSDDTVDGIKEIVIISQADWLAAKNS